MVHQKAPLMELLKDPNKDQKLEKYSLQEFQISINRRPHFEIDGYDN